ncbi:MAG: methyltransferase domain-containing protein [Acidobacteria bacterium]|nr:methyltransferase domain-containing protein [Acidobacteriota bacterium]
MFPNRDNSRHFCPVFKRFARGLILVFAGLLTWAGAVHRQNDVLVTGQSEYKGRRIAQVMGAAGADWLTREEREKFEQPEKALDALKIKPGMTVADVGAGNGYFTLRLARRVKDTGRVFAVDVQPAMLDLLKKNRDRAGLKNIDLVLGTETDAYLPPTAVDLALLVDVYHEFQQPEEMIAAVRASLKPDGVLVLVEYRGEDPSVPIKPEHKMTVGQVLREIEPMGFRLRKKLDFLPWQHIFIFEKAN